MFDFIADSRNQKRISRIVILLIIMISQPACEILGLHDQHPLITAAQNGDMIKAKESLRENVDINFVNEENKFALLEAAANDNLEMARFLVDNGADVNLSNKHGLTALMEASVEGSKDLVSFLIENGADLSMSDKKGYSALIVAIEEDNKDIVNLLVNKNAPLNDSSEDDISPLTFAVMKGDKEVVSILVENGADIDGTKKDGNTALHLAAVKANLEIAKLLMEKSADIHKKNLMQENPLMTMSGVGYDTIMNNIFERVKKTTDKLPSESSDPEDHIKKYSLVSLLKGVGKIDPELDTKETTNNKMDEFFEALENSTLSIDISEEKFNSLTDQLEADSLLIAKAFLDKGADVNEVDKNSQSVIMKICQQDNSISTIFHDKSIQLKPEVEKRFNKAFNVAVNIYKEHLQLFLDAGADVYLKDKSGQTALIFACEIDNFEFAKILVENGASVNISNKDGWTPLISAVSKEYINISELLVSNGANVNSTNAFGETALLKAVYRKNVPLIGLLLKNGADIDIANLHGDSPISVAQKKGYPEIINMLQ